MFRPTNITSLPKQYNHNLNTITEELKNLWTPFTFTTEVLSRSIVGADINGHLFLIQETEPKGSGNTTGSTNAIIDKRKRKAETQSGNAKQKYKLQRKWHRQRQSQQHRRSQLISSPVFGARMKDGSSRILTPIV